MRRTLDPVLILTYKGTLLACTAVQRLFSKPKPFCLTLAGAENTGEPSVVVSHGAHNQREWGNTGTRGSTASPVMHGEGPTSTDQTRSPSRGVHRQHANGEVPTAQRARALELQRLAIEREELETQLSEVKRLMRAANAGKMCWTAAATGISGDGLPETQARIVQRRKRKRRPSTAPSTNVARYVPDEYPTTWRGLGVHRHGGGNERSAWAERSGEEAGYSSAGETGCSRRDRSEERGCREVKSRQYVQRTPCERAVPERKSVMETLAASSSSGRPASAGCVRDGSRRRIVKENMAAAFHRLKSSPHRPATSSHPSMPRHPIGYQRVEVAATTERGRTAEILHSRGSPRLPTADRPNRETRKSPGLTIDDFTPREGRLKGGHWERGGHERGDEREASSLSRVTGNSAPSAWGENDGRASYTRRRAIKSTDTRRAFPTPVPFRYNCLGNVVEEIDNCYEEKLKPVNARGSYEYVFVPWGHTVVPKRDEGIGKPLPSREGHLHISHDGNLTRAAECRHEEAAEAPSCRNTSGNLRRTDLGVGADSVPGHSDSWSNGQEARSTQGGGASSCKERNRSDENGSVFQVWDKIIHEARGLRNGHVFEHIWIEYGNTSTATNTETHPSGSATAQGVSVTAQGGIRNAPSSSRGNISVNRVGSQLSSSRGNLSADREGSQSSIHHEHKDEISDLDDGKGHGQGPAPRLVDGPQMPTQQSEGGSSLYDVLLSDDSNSDKTWSMGSVETNEPLETLKAREKGGPFAVNGLSGPSAQRHSSLSPPLGGVGGRRKGTELEVSSSDGSSLYNNFSHGSRASDLNQRSTVKDPYVPSPPSKREEDLHEVVPHKSVENIANLKTIGNDGSRWANEQGSASQGTLESERPYRPGRFLTEPHQRRLDRQRSTGDRALGQHALLRNLAARNMGHRAGSLGRLDIEHGSDKQSSFDRTPLGGRPSRSGSLRGEGMVNDIRLLEQEASEGAGAGSSEGNYGRTLEEPNAKEAKFIDESRLEGKDARTPFFEGTLVRKPISVHNEVSVHSRGCGFQVASEIEGNGGVKSFPPAVEPSSVWRGITLVGERPPSGETPASENSNDRGQKPDFRDESVVDGKEPGGHLSPHDIQHRQFLEEGSDLDKTTSLTRVLGAEEDGIRDTDEELETNDPSNKKTPNKYAQHKQTLEGHGYVEVGVRDGSIGATESLSHQGNLDKIGSLDEISPQGDSRRESIDEGSLDEHERFLKEIPPVVEGTVASDQDFDNRMDGGDGRVTESLLDRRAASVDPDVRALLVSLLNAVVVGGTPRQEARDERKLFAETVTVDGERDNSGRGGRRGVIENESKNREALDEAPLEELSPSEPLDGGSADGWPLNDRPLAENPPAEQPLDNKPKRGDAPEELVVEKEEVDGNSSHHELPVKLLIEAASPPDQSEDNNMGETIASVLGHDGVAKDDPLDADAPLDELASLDAEQKPPRVLVQQGLLDGKILLAGQLPSERSVAGEIQKQSQEDRDSFDGHSAEDRSPGSTHESAKTQRSKPEGEGSLNEYLFDRELSGSHSLDRNSFDGQSLSDHDSENEPSLGGSSPDTGSVDNLSAMDDDLLFDDE